MLKQKRNLNIKNKFKKIQNKFEKRRKIISKIKRKIKNKSFFLNPNFQKLFIERTSLFPSKKIDIRVTPNNVFCTLKDLTNNKILNIGSAGKYKTKTSKKTLKFSVKVIIEAFLNEIKKELKTKTLLINLTGPIKLRKKILEQISKSIKKSSITINADNKKCFNGCRPKKKRRKKRKGLKVFK